MFFLGVATAAADTAVPAADVQLDATYSNATGSVADDYRVDVYGSAALTYSTAFAQGSPYPLVTAEANPGMPQFSYGATSFVRYYFSVNGPTTDGLIPIKVGYSLAASATTLFGSGYAQIKLDSVSSDFAQTSDDALSVSKSGLLSDNVFPGAIDAIEMVAQAGGYSDPITGEGSGFATVDPYIYVDPSFPNADQYTVTLSDGVVNALPEPGSLVVAVLAAGLLRRNRAKPRG